MADGVVQYIVRLTDKTKTGTRSAVQGSERLEKQTRDTTRAVDKLGDESAQTGRQLDRMGKEGKQAAGGMRGLARGMSGALTSVSGLTAGVGGLVATLGIGALVGTLTAATRAVFQFGQEVADLRNDISDASTRSGIAADTLQGLRLAAEGAGLSFGSITSTLDQFGRRMATAKGATNATAEAFAALEVEVEDAATGGLRDGDAVLRETLAALNAMAPSAERTALATETLGRSGARLLQALSGSELQTFVDLSEEFGVGVGPKAAKSAAEWQRATAALGLVMDGLKGQILDSLGGGADLILDLAETSIIAFETTKGALRGFVSGLGQIVDIVIAPFTALLDTIEGIGTALEELSRGNFRAAASAAGDAALSARDAAAAGITAAGTAAIGLQEGARGLFVDTAAGATTGAERGAQRAAEFRRLADLTLQAAATPIEDENNAKKMGEIIGDAAAKAIRDTQKERAEAEQAAAEAGGGPRRVGATQTELAAMLAEGDRNMAEQFAQLEAEAQATRAGRLETAQTAIGVTGQVLGGDLGGGLSSVAGATGMAGLGVAGAAVSGLQFIGEQGAEGIRDTLDGVKDGLIAALEALPELIGQILPQFAISLVAELIPALIVNAPEIFKSLLINLPRAIADALASVIGVESRTGRGALRGATFGAIIGAVGLGIASGGLLTAQGAAIGAGVGGAAGAGVASIRERRESGNARNSARTASAGQMSTARESDRLAAMSTRSRARSRSVQGNPFDALAAQFDAQFGTYGRATSTTIGVPA